MVCLVRSEDRKPSRRVFPLLQNLDLDTVTFDQVQGVGDPITIEDMNEQELQDLVLVNLARLVVSGEWTGLLEAGGGGEAIGTYAAVVPPMADGDGASYLLPLPIANNFSEVTNWNYGVPGSTSILMLWPWTVQVSGTMDELGVRIGSTAGDELYIGFYDSDSTNFYPSGAPLFTTNFTPTTNSMFTIDASSMGEVVAGDVLWLAMFGQVTKSKINCFNTGDITCAIPRIDSSLQYSVHQCGFRLGGETANTFPTITDAKEFDSFDVPSVPALTFSVT